MQVSERFPKIVGFACIAMIAAAILVSMCINPPAHVGAQNAGVVGIQAKMQPVFTAAAGTSSSPIFNDIGQGLNILFVCNTNFSGSIDLEWSPTKVAPFFPIVVANYSVDNACHTITIGGYWPNLRSTATFTATGSSIRLSAWYTSSSGPTAVSPAAIGSNGPTTPISCDHNVSVSVATGGTTWTAIGPINTNDTVVVCGFSLSFNGATSAGTVSLTWGATSGCGSLITNWALDTLASTPQFLSVPTAIQAPVGREFPCVQNSSGATAQVNVAWASVRL